MNKQRTLNWLCRMQRIARWFSHSLCYADPAGTERFAGLHQSFRYGYRLNGEPLIGASVKEKGAKTGVSTDIDGKFTISVKPGTTLEISYVGCKNAYVKASSSMQVTLEQKQRDPQRYSDCGLRHTAQGEPYRCCGIGRHRQDSCRTSDS